MFIGAGMNTRLYDSGGFCLWDGVPRGACTIPGIGVKSFKRREIVYCLFFFNVRRGWHA